MFPFMYPAIPDGFALMPTDFAKAASKRKKHAKLTKKKTDKMSKKKGRSVYETSSPSSSMHHLLSETGSIRELADTADTESVSLSYHNLPKIHSYSLLDASAEDPETRDGSDESPPPTIHLKPSGQHHHRRRSHSKVPVSFNPNRQPRLTASAAKHDSNIIEDNIGVTYDAYRPRNFSNLLGADRNVAREQAHHHRRRSQSKNPLSFLGPLKSVVPTSRNTPRKYQSRGGMGSRIGGTSAGWFELGTIDPVKGGSTVSTMTSVLSKFKKLIIQRKASKDSSEAEAEVEGGELGTEGVSKDKA